MIFEIMTLKSQQKGGSLYKIIKEEALAEARPTNITSASGFIPSNEVYPVAGS